MIGNHRAVPDVSSKMQLRPYLAFVLVLAACSGGASPDTTTTTTTPTTTSTSASTTTVETTTTTTEPPEEVVLPDTWLGVTEDYEAVEVDTATGEILRSIGQVSTAEDVETAECSACVNAVDAVWRSSDGTVFFLSECCEPAAGMIHVLTPDDLPYLPGDDAPTWSFWSASPSPDSDEVAFVGYQVVIADASLDPSTARPDVDYTLVWTSDDSDFFPISNAVWDDRRIMWLENLEGNVRLHVYAVDESAAETIEVVDLADWNSAVLARRADGTLVAARSPFDGDGGEAVVIDASGAVTERLPLEAGSRLGNYDPTGSSLIYADAEGVVRWLGAGTSGVLGEGFVFAGW